MIIDKIISVITDREILKDPSRMIEADAEEAAQNDEKVYEDDEMWTKGW